MVLMMRNFNIFGVHWKIGLLGGRSWKTNIWWGIGQFVEVGLARKRGVVFSRGWGGDTPMSTMIIFSNLELSRIDLPKLKSSILMEIVTIPVGKVDEFYFYMYHFIKAWLFEKISFELVYLFHIVLKALVSY